MSKSGATSTPTWREAKEAGMLPHEHKQMVNAAMQQIYPGALETCCLDAEVKREIERRDPREEGIQPIALQFDEPAAVAAGGAARNPAATPMALRNGKRTSETALDTLRYTPKPDKIEGNMSATRKTDLMKARKLNMEENVDIARVDAELKRIYGESFGEELTLMSGSRISARDEGFGVQLYWYALHTAVARMTTTAYNRIYASMQDASEDTAPEKVVIRLERYFACYEAAGRDLPESEKERIFLMTIEDCFGMETAAYIRGLPRQWHMNERDYGKRRFDMLRAAIVNHVRDEQPWPMATPGKIKVTRTRDSQESPLQEELQELKSQVAKLTQAVQSDKKKAKVRAEGVKTSPHSNRQQDGMGR
jgi:hypothetical protein